jgi:hypothetical protein
LRFRATAKQALPSALVAPCLQAGEELEAAAHNPRVAHILAEFAKVGLKMEPLGSITERVWWLTRFKRVFGEGGVRYLSSDELFQINPDVAKRVLIEQRERQNNFLRNAAGLSWPARVKPMAYSAVLG